MNNIFLFIYDDISHENKVNSGNSERFIPATIEGIKNALNKIKQEFGKEIAITVEKMYRLETANFKSTVFKHTNGAGLLWNEKYFKHRNKYCIYVLPVKDEQGNLIRNKIVPAGTEGAKKFCYVIFPTIYDGMKYLAIYLKRYGKDKGNVELAMKRWGGSDEYVQLVNNIGSTLV